MNTPPHDLNTFRRDLRAAMERCGCGQTDLVRRYGVSQASLSNFLNARRGLSADALLKLWAFVYGNSISLSSAQDTPDPAPVSTESVSEPSQAVTV